MVIPFRVQHYEKLAEKDCPHYSDDSTTVETPTGIQRAGRQRQYRVLVPCALSILIVLSIIQVILIATKHSHEHRIDEAPCGVSVKEAKEKGCHYSYSLGDWLHDECYDDEIEKKYLAATAVFEWYYSNADGNGPDLSRPMRGWDEVADQPFPVSSWTTERYHVDHCQAAWEYMHKMGLQGRKVSAGIAELHHTTHCIMETLDNSTQSTDIITGHINGFPPCVRLKGFKKTHKWPFEYHPVTQG